MGSISHLILRENIAVDVQAVGLTQLLTTDWISETSELNFNVRKLNKNVKTVVETNKQLTESNKQTFSHQ